MAQSCRCIGRSEGGRKGRADEEREGQDGGRVSGGVAGERAGWREGQWQCSGGEGRMEGGVGAER